MFEQTVSSQEFNLVQVIASYYVRFKLTCPVYLLYYKKPLAQMLILQTLILIDLFRQGKGGCKFFKKLLLKQTYKPTFLLEPLSIIKAELII